MGAEALAQRLAVASAAQGAAPVLRPEEQALEEAVHSSRSPLALLDGALAAASATVWREPALGGSGAGLAPQEEAAGERFRVLEAARQQLPELPVWPLPVDLLLPVA
jgi:hypothetical protein